MSRGMKISFIVILFVIGASLLGLITINVINRVQNRVNIHEVNVPPPGLGILNRTRKEPEIRTVNPLTIDQAKQAVNAYLAQYNNPDLVLKEIMIFQRNAYARVIEQSTGIGAMELLVDPNNLQVTPEYGADMMWNLKYGMMAGGRGGMMNPGYSLFGTPQALTSPFTMPVTADQAVKLAQQYLDAAQPGATADPNPDEFYGYYTVDILKNDAPVGMLSVNGYTGQIIYHDWHGAFITQQEW